MYKKKEDQEQKKSKVMELIGFPIDNNRRNQEPLIGGFFI